LAWKTDRWLVSHFNYSKEVRASFQLPEKVEIHDVTLRDGEQQAGVVFRKDDKINIACALDELGVHRIEAGMPAVSTEDFDAVKTIAGLRLGSKIFSFCRAKREDVDLALKCDVSGVVIESPTSDILIEKGFLWTREQMATMAIDALSYAKDHGLQVVFFPYDTTRASWDFESQLMKRAVDEAHVDSLVVVDTFGNCLPQAFAYLVRKVKDLVKVPVEVHCHNDLGLATANTLAGISAGAEVAHTTLNGLGERCGNTPFGEVAVCLLTLYGIDSGLHYEKIYKTSKLVAELSKSPVTPSKPVVGENCFAVESGIATMFTKRLYEAGQPVGALPYLPELVGQRFKIILGKKSGIHSIDAKLSEMKISATEQQKEQILAKVKELSLQKRSHITDEEFRDIVKNVDSASS